ncbi:MAG: hypothetical protein DRN06_05895 [Thermoprotei archaeon]|nr:MAG: hypothetical protein DRN06_05895 [Thermoprotei archaeon]
MKVMLKTVEGTSPLIYIPGSYLTEAVSRQAPMIALLANISSGSLKRHWLVFDYTMAYFKLYGDYGIDGTGLALEGYTPIVEWVDEYNVTVKRLGETLTWSEGQNKVGSPVIFVINPTFATRNWTFTWKDANGIWRFHVPELEGEVELDYLLFWEDLYYPPDPPSYVDDWRDHVVRVTMFTNCTYRIALYIAKGGYMHCFYLPAEEPYDTVPDQVSNLVYVKDYGEWWPPGLPVYAYSGYDVYESSTKIFYTRLGG